MSSSRVVAFKFRMRVICSKKRIKKKTKKFYTKNWSVILNLYKVKFEAAMLKVFLWNPRNTFWRTWQIKIYKNQNKVETSKEEKANKWLSPRFQKSILNIIKGIRRLWPISCGTASIAIAFKSKFEERIDKLWLQNSFQKQNKEELVTNNKRALKKLKNTNFLKYFLLPLYY